MTKLVSFYKKSLTYALTGLAVLANVTAHLSAGTASSWGGYQPQLPKDLAR